MPRGNPLLRVTDRGLVQQQEDPAQEGIVDHWWLEVGPHTSVIQLIHSLQRGQDRFAKGFFGDRIAFIAVNGQEYDVDEDVNLEIRIDYRRPETDEERVFRQEQERQQRIVDRERRRQEYLAMREEFGDNPQPEPQPEPVLLPVHDEGEIVPPMPNAIRELLINNPDRRAQWDRALQRWEVIDAGNGANVWV